MVDPEKMANHSVNLDMIVAGMDEVEVLEPQSGDEGCPKVNSRRWIWRISS